MTPWLTANDPLTQRIARTEREVRRDPLDWWEGTAEPPSTIATSTPTRGFDITAAGHRWALIVAIACAAALAAMAIGRWL